MGWGWVGQVNADVGRGRGFAADEELTAGRRAQMRLTRGRTRRVTVVKVLPDGVVVDTNHPRCGQWVVLEVEVVAILARDSGTAPRTP